MTIGSQKPPESILREALEVARDELKRVNDHYSCVRPDPFGVVIQALAAVPPLAPIEHASDIEKRIVGKLVTDLLAAGVDTAGMHILIVDGEAVVVTPSFFDAHRTFHALGTEHFASHITWVKDDPACGLIEVSDRPAYDNACCGSDF